jgi:hypothetical protein
MVRDWSIPEFRIVAPPQETFLEIRESILFPLSKVSFAKSFVLISFLQSVAQVAADWQAGHPHHFFQPAAWPFLRTDLAELEEILGKGPMACRVFEGSWSTWAFSTRWPYVWWRQPWDQNGALPHQALEVGEVPSFLIPDSTELRLGRRRLEELCRVLRGSNG